MFIATHYEKYINCMYGNTWGPVPPKIVFCISLKKVVFCIMIHKVSIFVYCSHCEIKICQYIIKWNLYFVYWMAIFRYNGALKLSILVLQTPQYRALYLGVLSIIGVGQRKIEKKMLGSLSPEKKYERGSLDIQFWTFPLHLQVISWSLMINP